MTTTRRTFLHAAVAAGTLGGLTTMVHARDEDETVEAAAGERRRVLILGGTGFIGPHIVRRAVQRGHTVTLFNRGQTNADLFPGLEQLTGDRADDLGALEGRTWDVCIDTHPWRPSWVRRSAQLLKDSVQQYVFVSSISAYADHSQPNMDETAPGGVLPEGTTEEDAEANFSGAVYGPLKVLCEQEAEKAFPGRATNIRPGLIVGEGDPTFRYTYWPVRIAEGGEVLAPGDGTDPVQIIDVRDLADFIVGTIEERTVGLYNVVTPGGKYVMKDLVRTCREATDSDATFTWVDAEFLAAQGVQPWQHMPAWVPAQGEYAGFGSVSSAKAVSAGLTFHSLVDTARSTIDWWRTLPEEAQQRQRGRAGISRQREDEVLEAWHTRASATTKPGAD